MRKEIKPMCSKASIGIWPSTAALQRSLMALLKEHWGKKLNVVLIAQLPEGFLQTEGNSVVRNQNWFTDKLGRNTEVCTEGQMQLQFLNKL